MIAETPVTLCWYEPFNVLSKFWYPFIILPFVQLTFNLRSLYIYLCCSLCLYLSLSSGQAFCKPVIPCLPGQFDASAGADLTPSRCHDCLAGFFRLDSDESSCLECAAGRYQSTNGSSACSSCQPGQHQQSTQQLSCSACDAGRGGACCEGLGILRMRLLHRQPCCDP